MNETIDLTFIGEQVKKLLAEQQRLRRDIADIRTLCLQGIDHSRRIERNSAEMKDDLELIVKSEIMGRLGNFEVKIEQRIEEAKDETGERFEKIEAKIDRILALLTPKLA